MCRKQVAAIILPLVLASLAGYSSEALSTFGVSNTKPPSATPTAPPAIVIGWLNIQSAEGFGISSFGKANTDPPKAQTTAAPLAPPCDQQSKCAGISLSSCVRTHFDPMTRCLCGDNQPPANGRCEAQTKALYHLCSNSDECNDGLICGIPNITGTAPPHLRVHPSQEKICLCDQENGFQEKEFTCNDADILETSLIAIFVVSCIRKLLIH